MSDLSSYYGAVQKILSGVTCNTFKEFSSLRSDEDRIKYVLGLDCVQKAFAVTYQNCTKSAAQSRLLRDKGNYSYQKHDYDEAETYYRQSICFAPWEISSALKTCDGEELALAFANRSATLYQMKKYGACLVDIDLAIFHKYPARLMYKIYDRKGRCHLALGNIAEAVIYFDEAIATLSLAGKNAQQQVATSKSIEAQLAECRSLLQGTVAEKQTSGDGHRPMQAPYVSGRPNTRFSSATQSFDIQYSDTAGRYVRSSEDTLVGNFFIVEKPYASVLSPKSYSNRCYHCFDRFTAPMPCCQCTLIRYCSERCRVASWDDCHELECSFLSQLVSSGTGNIARLALRVVMVTGLRRLLAGCKSNAASVFTDSRGRYKDGYPGAYNLVGNVDKRPTNNVFQYAILASYLVAILQKMDFFTTSPAGDDDEPDCSNAMSKQVIVGGVLLRFLQIIACNGVDVMQTNIGSSVDKSELVGIGLALYTTVSLLNHSCDPNADLIFYKDTCAVRTIQWIGAKQEVRIDYGYLYYSTCRTERRSSLKEQYFFDCACVACSFNWGTKASLKNGIPPLKCARCWVPLLLESRTGEDPKALRCLGCKTIKNPLLYFEALQVSSASAEEAYTHVKQWNILRAIPVLEKHITTVNQYVQQPWKEYVSCLSALKHCYRLLGNVNGIVPAAKHVS